jgi:5-formyltetrahydrofolate cyclo-ligase
MNKSALREYSLEKRLAITDSQRSRLDDLLLIQFQQWVIPDIVEKVLSYWPMKEKGEVNTFLITDFMAFRIPGMQLAYPVCDFKSNSLIAVGVTDETDFRQNKFGIGEPVDGVLFPAEYIDLVIVPLLSFDQKGFRLGYGKGFYDRYLSGCRPDTIKLGFSYFGPVDQLPGLDQYDIPLTACITPERIYEF